MANKQTEYNRGRQQGLEMAYRVLVEAGEKYSAQLIRDEINKRGKLGISTAATTKELEKATIPIKMCLYESFLCMTLITLKDTFGFGPIRCRRFIERWKLKESCMEDGLVNWREQVDAIKEELNIILPTDEMIKNELV